MLFSFFYDIFFIASEIFICPKLNFKYPLILFNNLACGNSDIIYSIFNLFLFSDAIVWDKQSLSDNETNDDRDYVSIETSSCDVSNFALLTF